MPKINWEAIVPVLRPHATVANGRELHWIGWCWQILDHQGLTSYGSEPEKAMVLMRAIALMRVHQDYAYIMLEIDPDLEEEKVFAELCVAFDCTTRSTLQWEKKRIMGSLIENYVEWEPTEATYYPQRPHDDDGDEDDEQAEDPIIDHTEALLNDLKKTLPGPDEGALIYSMYPDAYNDYLTWAQGVDSLATYHQWLDGTREAHIEVWIAQDWTLLGYDTDRDGGVLLYFHASWERVEPFFRSHLCWGTEEEVTWYRDMWSLLQDGGYTGFKVEFEAVAITMVDLVHGYQTCCALTLDRPVAIDPGMVHAELIKASDWCDPYYESVPNKIVTFLVKRLPTLPSNQIKGRYGQKREQDARTLFLRRFLASVPITDKSLERRYTSESAWRFDGPPGLPQKTYNEGLLRERMEKLLHWLETGER